MAKLWVGALGAFVLFALALILWARSNAVDCYPNCSPWQDFMGYLLLAAAALFVLLTVVALLLSAVRLLRRRDDTPPTGRPG